MEDVLLISGGFGAKNALTNEIRTIITMDCVQITRDDLAVSGDICTHVHVSASCFAASPWGGMVMISEEVSLL